MALQLQTAYDSFAEYKKDISDVTTAMFIDWCDWLNKFIYNHRLGIEPNKFIISQSYTVTTSPNTQALPVTFRDINKFGCGVYLVDSSGNDTDNSLTITGFGREDQGYYISDTNIVFTGMTNQTVKLRFIPKITACVALTGYFTLDTLISGKEIIPSDNLDFAIKALDVYYDQWDEDVGMEGIADQRFVRLLDDFSRNVPVTPTVYALDDPTLNF